MNSFSGHSRRGLLRTGLTILAGGMVATVARAQDADSKVEQSVVQYQTMPKDGAKCSGCVNFVAPNAARWWRATSAPKDGAWRTPPREAEEATLS